LRRLWRWIKNNVHGNGFACAHGYCHACAHRAEKKGLRYDFKP
jgi:hypothetical protein